MPRGKRKERAERANGPDFDLAASILREAITGLREESRSVAGDLSAAWKRIEDDCGVHKGAAKVIHNLLNKSPESRADFLRTFDGLRDHMELDAADDLVDLAESEGEGEGE
jgi:hypothetical protein